MQAVLALTVIAALVAVAARAVAGLDRAARRLPGPRAVLPQVAFAGLAGLVLLAGLARLLA